MRKKLRYYKLKPRTEKAQNEYVLHSLKQTKILLLDGQPSNPRRRKGKKKVSFQQEMKVKTTIINSLTFEMGKKKHIVIDVQRDGVNKEQQFPRPFVRKTASLKVRPICMYLCLHRFYKTKSQLK